MTQKNKKSRIKDTNYLVIQGFMVNQLNLKGNDLLIYAIIYGFSQTENQKFIGSLQYLADWTQSTKQGVIKSLKKLIKKGLIIKEIYLKNKIKYCKYSLGVLNRVEQGIKQSLMGGIKLSLPNNKDTYNKDNKKEDKNFLLFKKLFKKYQEKENIKDKKIELHYSQYKNRFKKCLKALKSLDMNIETQIENYLDFLKTENYRAKAGFEVWINQSAKFTNDWIEKKNEILKRKIKNNKKTSEDVLFERFEREEKERKNGN